MFTGVGKLVGSQFEVPNVGIAESACCWFCELPSVGRFFEKSIVPADFSSYREHGHLSPRNLAPENQNISG
jgi:hypothetical protein